MQRVHACNACHVCNLCHVVAWIVGAVGAVVWSNAPDFASYRRPLPAPPALVDVGAEQQSEVTPTAAAAATAGGGEKTPGAEGRWASGVIAGGGEVATPSRVRRKRIIMVASQQEVACDYTGA